MSDRLNITWTLFDRDDVSTYPQDWSKCLVSDGKSIETAYFNCEFAEEGWFEPVLWFEDTDCEFEHDFDISVVKYAYIN